MSRFTEKAIDRLLYTRNNEELEARFEGSCDYCCTHSCRSCKGCPVKSAYEGLKMGFEIAEKMATRKRDIVRA